VRPQLGEHVALVLARVVQQVAEGRRIGPAASAAQSWIPLLAVDMAMRAHVDMGWWGVVARRAREKELDLAGALVVVEEVEEVEVVSYGRA
jgi:hypothetical protein